MNLGRDYINSKTGEFFHINISGSDFLDKITIGLFPKYGCFPKTPEDCKLVARIIKNHILYQERGDWDLFLNKCNVDKLSKAEQLFFKDFAEFLENAENGVRY